MVPSSSESSVGNVLAFQESFGRSQRGNNILDVDIHFPILGMIDDAFARFGEQIPLNHVASF
jgi:hypothetical protein